LNSGSNVGFFLNKPWRRLCNLRQW